NGGKNSLNRLIRCVCGKKIGPDPRNFNQRVSLGRNDLLIRTFLSRISPKAKGKDSLSLLFSVSYDFPGKADLITNHDFQELYLLFLNEDNL
ncbi:hypothetical protein LN380_25735, partial [Enterobacter hormaechei subsp. steigerwaltii]|nr:hypothetical protein [Enterobacter hormaechei subsp. steigerwaltii]MCC9356319.1 hypothetical protein [Enterobacter hormaechei subsp. steigerwaltii]MCC9406761.1 hypothetical protein [Enterobacter hormaechei subsp. steigerwaltii]